MTTGNAAPRLPLSGVHVLVVEDNDEVRDTVVTMLRRAGATVRDAARPSAAIEALRSADDDTHVAVIDILLPEMSGPECADILREERPDVAIGYMSGYADMTGPPEQRETDDERAPPLHLQKPFAMEELVAFVRKLMARRSLARFSVRKSAAADRPRPPESRPDTDPEQA